MSKDDIRSMELKELESFITSIGDKSFRAKQIYDWLHVKLVDDFEEMSNLSKALRDKLEDTCNLISLKTVDKRVSAVDGTTKFLFELEDGNIIESVLMRYKHGNSVCISSQAGCKMGCKFCASTLAGLSRNLTPSEMLSQIYQIQKSIGERVSNVVVMGTGEPLDNYDNLVKFIKLISNENGLNISQRNITVSTCGLVDKIERLANERLQITLAISLHAPNDEKRKQIMPIANKYNIKELLDVCKFYVNLTGRRLTVEYSLIKGFNDGIENAEQLSSILRNINCHVNLIPVNPIKERDYKQSTMDAVDKFKRALERHSINVTVRRELGQDIQAACGQLRKSYIDNNI